MSQIPSEWTADQWRDHFLAQPEYVAKEVLDHPRKQGAERLGAGMAQQVREDSRFGEAMVAASSANRLARDSNELSARSLFRSNLSLIFSVVAIAVTIGIAVWQHFHK